MHKTSISPDEVLETLLAKGPRSNKAMTKALHEVCREQYSKQNDYLRDFSLPTIGEFVSLVAYLKPECSITPRRTIMLL